MTSSSPARRRARLLGAVTLACAVAAGGLTSLGTGTAAAALLPAPPVLGPADADPVLKEVVLDWAGVAGAASYVVQVGTDEQWSDDPTLELKTVATRLTLPTSLPHASYVWRVAAVSADGQGHWSSTGTFTRGWQAQPRLLAPANGQRRPGPRGPDLPLDAGPRRLRVPAAAVSTSPFDDGAHRQADAVTQSCFTTRTTVTPFNGQVRPRHDGAGDCTFTLITSGVPLHWRVRPLDRVVDDAPVVDTTPVVDEGITSRPPAPADELDTSPCPEPLDPVATSAPIAGTPPQPSASPSAGPSASRRAPAAPPPAPARRPAPPPAPGAADDEPGSCEPAHTVEKGAWSAPGTFLLAFTLPSPAPHYADLPAPARPSASSDSCVERTCRDFPTVSWPRVPGAQWYRVTVALDADYRNIQSVVETPAQTWTPTTQWRESTAGASYYVVVQACTLEPAADGRRAGCDSPSAPLLVRKTSPRLALTGPAAGAAVGGSEVVLSWQAASTALAAATGRPATSEAYAYRVQVTGAGNPGFTAKGLLDDATVDSTHHVSTEVRYPDGQYLWRVQAVDASGHRLPWSATGTFSRDGSAPTFTVGSAGRLAPTGAVAVVFSEPVTGISARTVRMSGVLATVSASADGRRALLAPGRPLLPGAAHTVSLEPGLRDRAGNAVAARAVALTVDPVVDDRSPVMVLSGTWKRLAATNAVGGTWSRSVPTAARPVGATVALHGRAAEVKGCVGPSNGLVEVLVDGVRVAQVDSYRSYSGCGVVLTRASFPKAGPHRVQVRGTGTKGPRSRGTAVALDAVTAVR